MPCEMQTLIHDLPLSLVAEFLPLDPQPDTPCTAAVALQTAFRRINLQPMDRHCLVDEVDVKLR